MDGDRSREQGIGAAVLGEARHAFLDPEAIVAFLRGRRHAGSGERGIARDLKLARINLNNVRALITPVRGPLRAVVRGGPRRHM